MFGQIREIKHSNWFTNVHLEDAESKLQYSDNEVGGSSSEIDTGSDAEMDNAEREIVERELHVRFDDVIDIDA